MTSDPIVLLAKFVPDMHRMEPRNIGVVVWDNGRVVSRFLGKHPTRVKPPSFVPEESRHAYRQWITYWSLQLERKTIRRRDGANINRDSPEFLEILAAKRKPRFFLSHCATLMEGLNGSIGKAAEEFFNLLVKPMAPAHEAARQAAKELKIASGRILHDAGLTKPGAYLPQAPITRTRHGVTHPWSFDYAIAEDSKVVSLFERVLLNNAQSVASAGWKLQWVQDADEHAIPKSNCGIFYNSQLHEDDALTNSAVEALRDYGTLIDTARHDEAVDRVKAVVSPHLSI